MVRGHLQDCERSRASISAGLDGELSEFESLQLQAHLERCQACSEFEASARVTSTALRMAPMEALSRPLVLPSRRKRALGLRVPSAAAAAVLMVFFGGVFESLHGGAPRPSSVTFDDRADGLAIAKRQKQANFQQLLIRRAQYESNQIPRHPGYQP
jgi:hypothetical protein